jgi:hypothetical protein
VLAVDKSAGALLIEAIEPGLSLTDSTTYPHLDTLGTLVNALHAQGAPDPTSGSVAVADRVTYLYEAGKKNYARRPDLAAVIAPELYERGRRLALRLPATRPRPFSFTAI